MGLFGEAAKPRKASRLPLAHTPPTCVAVAEIRLRLAVPPWVPLNRILLSSVNSLGTKNTTRKSPVCGPGLIENPNCGGLAETGVLLPLSVQLDDPQQKPCSGSSTICPKAGPQMRTLAARAEAAKVFRSIELIENAVFVLICPTFHVAIGNHHPSTVLVSLDCVQHQVQHRPDDILLVIVTCRTNPWGSLSGLRCVRLNTWEI